MSTPASRTPSRYVAAAAESIVSSAAGRSAARRDRPPVASTNAQRRFLEVLSFRPALPGLPRSAVFGGREVAGRRGGVEIVNRDSGSREPAGEILDLHQGSGIETEASGSTTGICSGHARWQRRRRRAHGEAACRRGGALCLKPGQEVEARDSFGAARHEDEVPGALERRKPRSRISKLIDGDADAKPLGLQVPSDGLVGETRRAARPLRK